MKKLLFFLCFFLLIGCFSFSALAEGNTVPIELSYNQSVLTDGKETESVTVSGPLVITAEKPIESLYLIYFDTPTDLTLFSDGEEKSLSVSFLRKYISIKDLFGEGKREIILNFSSEADLMEIYAFSENVPSWVQIWEEPAERADLCLFTTHADDEQLFFAGVLPYYAGEKDLEVQVIYFVDHNRRPLRRHELLRGLWAVGVKNYPVIPPFPDRLSHDEGTAEKHFLQAGFSREDILSFQVETLRRFQPLVVVGHDPLGEYGHGQHILNSKTLQEAVLSAGDPAVFPDSAEQYGVWEVPKTYLHLLDENPIVMNWDEPLSYFNGKTAFEMTKIGFSFHTSQHKDWFLPWLTGEDGQRKKASEIEKYSPCKYGLFRSLVGEDVEKNDFFENLLSYEERASKEEEERLRLEAEEKKRLEEENRKALEIEKKLREEKEKKEGEEKTLTAVLILSVLILAVVAVSVFCLWKKKNKK